MIAELDQTLTLPESIPLPSYMRQGEFEFGKVSPTGIVLNEDTPEKEWHRIAEELCRLYETTGKIHAQAAMMIGDVLVFGEAKFGEAYADVIDATREFIRVSTRNLQRWSWVAARIAPDIRNQLLSLAHHEEVAPLAPELQSKYLTVAVDENMTVKELRKKIREDQPSKKPRKKKEKDETDPKSIKAIEEQMINSSNWISAHLDQLTDKMEGPLKKFYSAYRRKFMSSHGKKKK